MPENMLFNPSPAGNPVFTWFHPGGHIVPPGSAKLILDFFRAGASGRGDTAASRTAIGNYPTRLTRRRNRLTRTILLITMMAIPWHGNGQPPSDAAPNGIYSLSEDIKPVSERVMNHPDLAGVSLRGRWNEFQPGKDIFEWSFDDEIGRAQRAGKKVFLRVDPSRMPDWMLAEGVQSFAFRVTNIHSKDFGQSKNMAVPWDPVFLSCWSNFIKRMGQKYAHDSTVVMVQMAGANQGGGELHLPSDPEAKQQWLERGYTEEKLVTAYKQIIDTFDAAFLDKPLGLNLSEALSPDGAAEEIAEYAFQKLGKRLCIQHNALHATTKPEAFKIHKIVRSYAKRATVGFQLLSPASSKKNFEGMGNGFGGGLHTAFDIGLDAGASYFEIYPMDIDDPASAADIHQLSLQLKR